MIDYDYPDLFLGDAVYKDFIITDGEVEVINDDSWAVTAEATVAIRNVDLESESFELHQSLNSEMQLRFGSCESAYISFVCHSAWWGDIANLKGKVLNVYIIPNNHATKIIQIGVFKVQENKLTNDRKARKVTAFDAMYDILNSDVADWYNNVAFMPIPIAPEPSVAMSSFRNFFLAYFGLEAEETTLVNDSIVLHKTINPETLSGADVIKAICEINGVFGMITNEGKFRFVELLSDIREAGQGVTELDVGKCIDVEYEDYDSKAINGVRIITNNDAQGMGASTNKNYYVINGNFLISDYKHTDITLVAKRLLPKLTKRYYQPLTVNALGNPVHEVGDAIKVILKDGTELPTYILERNLRGIQALRDTYTARGEEEASESLNSISSRYSQFENNIAQAATEAASVASTTDFVEIIRNIGFRLLDEPSDVVVEYDEENQQVELSWTDPSDIATNEPCPATWAGTVVVRKENSIPKHRWDGTLIVDSTTRDEYSSSPLIDNTVHSRKQYYYGIFPYDTKGDYRFTKAVMIRRENYQWTCDADYLKSGQNTVLARYNHSTNLHRTYYKLYDHKCICVCIYPGTTGYVGCVLISDDFDAVNYHFVDEDRHGQVTTFWSTEVDGNIWYVSQLRGWVTDDNNRNTTNTPEIDGSKSAYSDFLEYGDNEEGHENPPSSFYTSLNTFTRDVLDVANVVIS